MQPKSLSTPLLSRMAIDVFICAHLVVCGAYWWLSPKGFPVGHPRFWLNSVLPIAVAALCTGLIVAHRRSRGLSGLTVVCVSLAWGAAAFAGSVMFPSSLRWLWVIGLGALLLGALCSRWLVHGERVSRLVSLPCLAIAFALGWFVIWAQRPDLASTIPMNVSPPTLAAPSNDPAPDFPITFGAGHVFQPSAQHLTAVHGELKVTCTPLLDFDRISPDGFWSIFAPARKQYDGQKVTIPRPSVQSHSISAGLNAIHYSDGSVVEFPVSAAPDGFEVTAHTPVERDTYSHLNSYCFLIITGVNALSLSFSPTAEKQIDVVPSDYPFGRPARFAYLDDEGTFSIVEASSGEKGPFHTLASGALGRGDPLTITFNDDGKPLASITFDDWSQQASTAPSPTAGWRVPVNAIEFRRIDIRSNSHVLITFTLAATSVGRGWDSVGHRAGTYRNRLRFQFLPK
jgi:hypothetical protein